MKRVRDRRTMVEPAGEAGHEHLAVLASLVAALGCGAPGDAQQPIAGGRDLVEDAQSARRKRPRPDGATADASSPDASSVDAAPAPDAPPADAPPPPDASPSNGDKIVFVSARDGNSEIYTVNIDGTELIRRTYDASIDEQPAWSPDGQRIAFVSNRSGTSEIYVMNADGTNVVRRTFSASYNEYPTWSPDGSKIAYSTLSDGSANIWIVSPNTGSPSPLFAAPGWDSQPDWSPDGARLALSSDWYAYDIVKDVFHINSNGSGFTALTGDIFDHVDYAMPAWSPDGAKLSLAMVQTVGIDQYVTNLGVMNADGSGLRPLISAAAETRSSWSPDGQKIAFTTGSGASRSVSWVKADGSASGVIVTDGWSADWRP